MSVIQSIQEKYAKLMAIIIAVALMIFVVMLAFENGGSLFRGNSTTVGRVNGTKIDYNEFYQKVQQQEANIAAQYGGSMPEGMRPQAVESAWNSEVNEILLDEELDKLGITVGKRELGDLLYGPNGPEEFKRIPGFTDTLTGQYNGQFAKTQIDALLRLKKGTPEQLQQRDQFIAFIQYQERKRMSDKYSALLTNSINFPKWFVEKQIADNSQLATISLVRDNYSDHKTDSIKISDAEIKEYLDKHKEDYKQPESRSVSYVAFSTRPSAADSAAAKDKLTQLRTQFDTTTTNLEPFLISQGLTYPENYTQASALPLPIKDTITRLPVNSVVGPYVDNNGWTLAKLIGKRNEPEMVKVRHILVATARQNPQTGQMTPVRDTAEARNLIDSLERLIKNGSARFDSLALKFSDDNPNVEDKKANKYKIGIYDSVKHGVMVPEFDNFIFGHGVGAKGVVKTQFGYHYIEILAQEGKSFDAYKVAYLPIPIEVSNETEAAASNEANQFASSARDQKTFDAAAEKLLKEKGINKAVANDIIPSSYYVGTLGEARSLVKDIYDAKLGEVLEPKKAGDAWVVAIVTEVNEEGTQSVAKARATIEPVLRNKKLAESLKKKVGTITTLEAAASALGGKQIESIDSLRMSGVQSNMAARAISNEPKVVGASFNPSNRGKVVPEVIEGQGGVFVVRVDNVSAGSNAQADIAAERRMRYEQAKQTMIYRSPLETLRKAATIKDRRVNFF